MPVQRVDNFGHYDIVNPATPEGMEEAVGQNYATHDRVVELWVVPSGLKPVPKPRRVYMHIELIRPPDDSESRRGAVITGRIAMLASSDDPTSGFVVGQERVTITTALPDGAPHARLIRPTADPHLWSVANEQPDPDPAAA